MMAISSRTRRNEEQTRADAYNVYTCSSDSQLAMANEDLGPSYVIIPLKRKPYQTKKQGTTQPHEGFHQIKMLICLFHQSLYSDQLRLTEHVPPKVRASRHRMYQRTISAKELHNKVKHTSSPACGPKDGKPKQQGKHKENRTKT